MASRVSRRGPVALEPIEPMIREIRGIKVILDTDLARVYGIPTFRLNEAVKRNGERFPSDFVFRLTRKEVDSLTSQSAMSKKGRGGRRTLPFAFTEYGAIMAANVLNSPRAVQMSVFIVRAFVRMRGALADTNALAKRLAALEKELKDRLDVHESVIVTVLQRIMELIDPPHAPELPEPPRRKIGFEIKEPQARYRTRSGR